MSLHNSRTTRVVNCRFSIVTNKALRMFLVYYFIFYFLFIYFLETPKMSEFLSRDSIYYVLRVSQLSKQRNGLMGMRNVAISRTGGK